MLAERINKYIVWSKYDSCGEKSHLIGQELTELLGVRDAASSKQACFNVENSIAPQGAVYNAAVPALQVLMAALIDPRPKYVRIAIYNILYVILNGEEVNPLESSLIAQCRNIVTEGYWSIVRDLIDGPEDSARDILQLLSKDFDYESLLRAE